MSLEITCDEKHRYWQTRQGKKKRLPAVTTICGMYDKSRALMGYTAKVNAEEAIKRIEAVGMEENGVDGGIHPNTAISIIQDCKNYYNEYRDQAASIGTQVHDLIVQFFKGEEPDLTEKDDQVKKGYNAFLEVVMKIDFKVIDVERTVYMEGEPGTAIYAGRLDVVVEMDGKTYVWDWKTATGIYESAEMQVAAYAKMYHDETGTEISGTKIWQLSKETGHIGDIREFNQDETTANLKAFNHCWGLYVWNRNRKKNW